MTVKGNVIACETCGQQIAMPRAPRHADKRSLDESIRAYAVSWGWEYNSGGDYCPAHQAHVGASGPSPLDRVAARVRHGARNMADKESRGSTLSGVIPGLDS